ncbi:MAG: MBL fold metallo-hydrolase [Henriciella sp.]|nr:MBL fold metallo-hydrolase [Henriciella sp.]
MRIKWIIGLVAVVIGAGFLALNMFKANIGEAAYKRAVPKQLSANLIDELGDGLHVVLCGTGSPMPDPSRKGPCTAVLAGERLFVVDVGAGAARNFGPMGLSSGRTEAVLLTHFHSDHISGLGDFLIQRWASTGAMSPLTVHGPNGTVELIDALNAFYSFDQQYRVKHHGDLMPASGYGAVAAVFDLDAERQATIVNDGGLKITAFGVDHGDIEAAVGYRFDYKGRSVVISGDTARSANLERYAKGADILVHEALNTDMIDVMSAGFAANEQQRMSTIFQQIKGIHATPVEAAQSAAIADVQMLVLSHIIPPSPSPMLTAYYLRGAGKAFDGKIVMGEDGMVFSLPPESTSIQRDKRL